MPKTAKEYGQCPPPPLAHALRVPPRFKLKLGTLFVTLGSTAAESGVTYTLPRSFWLKLS